MGDQHASSVDAEGRQEALRHIADEYLQTWDSRVDDVVAELQREIAEYRSVPSEDVRNSTAAIVRSVVRGVTGEGVDPADVAPLDELARRRVAQGFPLEALTRSIQLAARFVLRDIQLLADRDGVDPRVLLNMHDDVWDFANAAASVISAINRELTEDLARRDVGRRSDFLRGLLHGTLDARRVQADATLYGLDPAVRYHPLRARPATAPEEETIAMALRRSGSTQRHRAVLGVTEGELVALVPQRPKVPDEVLVALGEARDLTAMRDSFAATRLTLDTAAAFGRSGLVTLADLGPLPLALEGDELERALEQQYFEALDREAQTGQDIETTTLRWLELDQRPDDVAAALHVHRNTVRYRLGRFKDLTGLDIRQTGDLVTAWWLLHRRAVRRHREG